MAYSSSFKAAVVEYARRHSILAAATYFKISRNTVCKWYRATYASWKMPDDDKEYIVFETN